MESVLDCPWSLDTDPFRIPVVWKHTRCHRIGPGMMECAGCLAFFASIFMMHGDAMKKLCRQKRDWSFSLDR